LASHLFEKLSEALGSSSSRNLVRIVEEKGQT
jgi:hypothetical protein